MNSLHDNKHRKFKLRRVSTFLTLAFTIYGVLIHTIPTTRWIGELLALSLSIVLPLFLLVVFFYLLKEKSRLWVFILPLILFISPLKHWASVSFSPKKEESPTLKIASFNTATLDLNRFLDTVENINPSPQVYSKMYQWVRENKDIDILCLQEFYEFNSPDVQSIIDSIYRAGDFQYYCINPSFSGRHVGFFGVIIFSKKIPFHCGKIIYGREEGLNKGLYVDFKEENGDTLRVINLHLSSMSIRWGSRSDRDYILYPISWVVDTYYRLKEGFIQREKEIDNIENFLLTSPKNTVLCGDFNATPHMNANKRMRNIFKDSFLESGLGLGFSYHHFPYIIRIDYQYFRGNVKALDFMTDRSARFSDHFPIIATYRLKGKIKNHLRDTTLDFLN